MDQTDLIKLLSTPGAIVVAIIWLHSRLKNVETRLEMLATHIGAPRPVTQRKLKITGDAAGESQSKTIPISRIVSVLALTATLLMFCSGCNSVYQQTTPAKPAETNQVAMLQTLPNGQTQLVTNTVVTPAVPAQYEYVPMLTAGMNTAKTVSGFIPPPYGTVAGIALTAVSAILGFILKRKNGQLSTTQTILQSVITGVEAAGDATTKVSIQSHATAAGVQQDLEPVVQNTVANSPGAILNPAKA
jgi:hypothetical protein